MASEALTPERILEATEEVLRRFGASKATVVDVARSLGVSHAGVYRHFRTKAALREAVTRRWLDRTTERLLPLVSGPRPAEERLDRWLKALSEARREMAGDEPELFATYSALAAGLSGAVEEHIEDLVNQLARLVENGRARGEFSSVDVGDHSETARAVLDVTMRFHDPAHAAQWSRPGIDEAFASVRALILRGLRA